MHHFHLADLFDTTFWLNLGRGTLDTTGDVLKIIVIYALLRAGLRRLIRRVVLPIVLRTELADGSHAARLRTLASLLNSVVAYVLTFIFGVMLLRAFHLDPIPLLTTASVAGLAVGFGAQKLVKDVISGFFILLENQYAVGDFVIIGTVTGTVEEVGMRTTRIRDEQGRLYLIGNGDITQVCNQSRSAVATFIEIGVAVDADITKVRQVIDDAGVQLANSQSDLGFVQPPAMEGISAMEAAKLTLRICCATRNPGKLTNAQIALRGIVREHLLAAGIAIA